MAKTLRDRQGPSLFKQILLFALPFMLTAELQLLFNTVDLIVIGQFAGSLALAAVGANSAVVNLVVNVAVNFTVGVTVIVANNVGAKNDRGVQSAVQTSFCLSLALGILLAVLGVIAARGLLILSQTPDEILEDSVLYFRIYALGLPALAVYNSGAGICRGAGDSKTPLIFLTLSGVLNAGLNLFFVVVFHWDVVGVAAATSISNYAAAIAVTVFLCRVKDARRMDIRHLSVDRDVLRRMCALGLPAAGQSCMFNIANFAIQASVNTLGSTVIAASAAALSIENFTYTGNSAIGQSAVTFIGQQVGAGEFKKINHTLLIVGILESIFAWALAAGCLLFGKQLLSLYITDNPEALAQGLKRLNFMAWTFALGAYMDLFTNALRGLGQTKIPMYVTMFGVCCVRFLWIAFVFPHFHTLVGLHVAYPVTYFIAMVCEAIAYRKEKKKLTERAGVSCA